MKLRKTDTGKPFIQLDEGQLFFSDLTATKKGWKYISFKTYTVTELCTSAANRKKPVKNAKTVKIGENVNVILDMEFKRGRTSSKPEGVGPPNGTMKRKTTAELREIFSKYVDEDLIFPFDKLKDLKAELNTPKKVKRKRTTSVPVSSSKPERIQKKKKRVMKRKSRPKKKTKRRKKK